MTASPPPKPPIDEFVKTCTPLLKIPELEAQMRERVQGIVSRLFNFERKKESAVDSIKRFLREDKDFLGVMLALSNLSQEKFLRILTAERFAEGDFDTEWGIARVRSKLKADDEFADKIARLLLEGRGNKFLAEKVADFYLDQLSLAENWQDVIRSESVIARAVRHKLVGEYTDLKGEFIEREIRAVLDKVKNIDGIPHEKGQVPLLGKEADHAIPSIENPRVVVMSSYLETTSSSQTARANEQRAMFSKLREDNERYPNRARRILVNFVDGGGWLARRSDLAKMHASCDYCINMNTLKQLAAIVRYHSGAVK